MKRALLLSFLLFIPVTFHPSFQSYEYVTPVSFVCGYCFFINVPSFALWTYRKPLWFEDLVDETAISPDARERFQKQFVYVLEFLLTCVFTSIVDYGMFRFRSSQFSILETLALLGGLLSLFAKIQSISGKVVLFYIAHRRERAISISSLARMREDSLNQTCNAPIPIQMNTVS